MAIEPFVIDVSSVLRALKVDEFAKAEAQKYSIKEERRKAIFLVDVQSIYLKLVTWMENNDVPLQSGDLIGNISACLIYETAHFVEQRDVAGFSPRGIDYRTFAKWVIDGDDARIRSTKKIDRWSYNVELFFAPSPLIEAQSRLKNALRNGRTEALSKLERLLEKGVVPVHGRPRDYMHYDDFVVALKRSLDANDSEQGFFNFSIDQNGLKYFDEKEVDIRIAVRAMDIMQGEADAICIVSSDQDFMPLHQRCRDGGLRTYHADVAKFDQRDNIGRKIKELGDDWIFVEMPKWMSENILHKNYQTMVSSPHYISLTSAEYGALMRLYEKINGHQFGE